MFEFELILAAALMLALILSGYLYAKTKGLKAQISSLKAQTSSFKQQPNGPQPQTSDLEALNVQLESRVSELQSEISGYEMSKAGLEEMVTRLQIQISGYATSKAGLEGRVSDLNADNRRLRSKGLAELNFEELKATVLNGLWSRNRWGGKYVPVKSMIYRMSRRVKNNGKMVRGAIDELLNEGLLLAHKGGDTVSLNTKRKKEIIDNISQYYEL